MSNDVFKDLKLDPRMQIGQLMAKIVSDFYATGLTQSEFDVPGMDMQSGQQFLLHFEVSLRKIDNTERKH